jgi:hypothetical protein
MADIAEAVGCDSWQESALRREWGIGWLAAMAAFPVLRAAVNVSERRFRAGKVPKLGAFVHVGVDFLNAPGIGRGMIFRRLIWRGFGQPNPPGQVHILATFARFR